MNAERLHEILRAPRTSEKTARLQTLNQYVFEVARDATKQEVKTAVEQLFSVKVNRVTVVNVKGKTKGFRGRGGRRSDWRKAYVSLPEGQTIELLAQA